SPLPGMPRSTARRRRRALSLKLARTIGPSWTEAVDLNKDLYMSLDQGHRLIYKSSMRSAVYDILPAPVRRSLSKFGKDLSVARRKRSLTVAMMAERLAVSRATYGRVEK